MRIRWEIEDGYVGSSTRPQYTDIDEGDISECADETDVRELIEMAIQEDFEYSITYHYDEENVLREALKYLCGDE